MKKVVCLFLLLLLNFQSCWAETSEGKVATQEPVKTFKIAGGYIQVYKNKVFIHKDSFLEGHIDKTIYFKDIISIGTETGFIFFNKNPISIRFNTSEPIICDRLECNKYDNEIYPEPEKKGRFYGNPDMKNSFNETKAFLENQLEQYKESH